MSDYSSDRRCPTAEEMIGIGNKVLQALKVNNNIKTVDDLKSVLHVNDISIPDNYASNQFESLVISILQHATRQFSSANVEELQKLLFEDSEMIGFESSLCHIKMRLKLSSHKYSVEHPLNVAQEIASLINNKFKIRVELVSKVSSELDVISSDSKDQLCILWLCPEDNLFHTFVNRPALYANATEYGEALLEDVRECQLFQHHFLAQLATLKTSLVFQHCEQYVTSVINASSLGQLVTYFQAGKLAPELKYYILKYAQLELEDKFGVTNEHILTLLKNELLTAIEYAFTETILSRKRRVEVEEDRIVQENENLSDDIEMRKAEIEEFIQESDNCKIKLDEATEKLHKLDNEIEKSQSEQRGLEQQRQSLLQSFGDTNGSDCRQRFKSGEDLKVELEKLQQEKMQLDVAIVNYKKDGEVLEEQKKKLSDSLRKLRQKQEWHRFVCKLTSLQPNAAVLSKLMQKSSFAKCKFFEELVCKVIKVFSIYDEFSPKTNEYFWNFIRRKPSNCKEFTLLLGLLTQLYCQSPTVKRNLNNLQIIEVTGRYIPLSLVLSSVFDELKYSPPVYEIRFVASETLFIDYNIEMPGINVVMAGKNIEVCENVTISTSGNHARQFDKEKADNATRNGEDGDNGKHGLPGQNAGNIFIRALENVYNIHQLTLLANGGNGSDGQSGGDGSNGNVGRDGRDGNAKQPSSGVLAEEKGETGEHGQSGGRGGDAGRGGQCGRGGDISVKRDNEEIAFECREHESNDGISGHDGKPGKGGEGGLGGRNGVDSVCAWESWEYFGMGYLGDWMYKKGKYELQEQKTVFGNLKGYTIVVKKTEDEVRSTRSSKENKGRKGHHASKKSSSSKSTTTDQQHSINLDAISKLARAVEKTYRIDAISADCHEQVSASEKRLKSLSQQSASLQSTVRNLIAQSEHVTQSAERTSAELEEERKISQQILAKHATLQQMLQNKNEITEHIKQLEESMANYRQMFKELTDVNSKLQEKHKANSQRQQELRKQWNELQQSQDGMTISLQSSQQVITQRQMAAIKRQTNRLGTFPSAKQKNTSSASSSRAAAANAVHSESIAFLENLLKIMMGKSATLGKAFESCIQRASLSMPLEVVCSHLEKICDQLIELTAVAVDDLSVYLTNSFFKDLILAESLSSFNATDCDFVQHLTKILNVDPNSSIIEILLKLRFWDFNTDTTVHLDWLLAAQSNLSSEITQFISTCHSIVKSLYVKKYAKQMNELETAEAKEEVNNTLTKISKYVEDLQSFVPNLSFIEVYEQLNFDARRLNENFLLKTAGLSSDTHSYDSLLDFFHDAKLSALVADKTLLDRAIIVFRNIFLSVDQLNEYHEVLLRLKCGAILSDHENACHLLSQVDCFINAVFSIYSQDYLKQLSDNVSGLLSKNALSAQNEHLGKKILEALHACSAPNTMKTRLEFLKKLQLVLDNNKDVSAEGLRDKMNKLYNDVRSSIWRLPRFTLSNDVNTAVMKFNESFTASHANEVLKLLLKKCLEAVFVVNSSKACASGHVRGKKLFKQVVRAVIAGSLRRIVTRSIERHKFEEFEHIKLNLLDCCYRLQFYIDNCEILPCITDDFIYIDNFGLSLADIEDLCKCISSAFQSNADNKVADVFRSVFEALKRKLVLYAKDATQNIEDQLRDEYSKIEEVKNDIKKQWQSVMNTSHGLLEPTKEFTYVSIVLDKHCHLSYTYNATAQSNENLQNVLKLVTSGELQKAKESLCESFMYTLRRAGKLRYEENEMITESGIDNFVKSCEQLCFKLSQKKADEDINDNSKLEKTLSKFVLIATYQIWEANDKTCEKVWHMLGEARNALNATFASDNSGDKTDITNKMQTLIAMLTAYVKQNSTIGEYFENQSRSLLANKQTEACTVRKQIIADTEFLLKSWNTKNSPGFVSDTIGVGFYLRTIKTTILAKWQDTEHRLIVDELQKTFLLAFVKKLESGVLLTLSNERLSSIIMPLFEETCTVEMMMSINRKLDEFSQSNATSPAFSVRTKLIINDTRRIILICTNALLNKIYFNQNLPKQILFAELYSKVEQLARALFSDEYEKLAFILEAVFQAYLTIVSQSQQQLTSNCLDQLMGEILRKCLQNENRSYNESNVYHSLALARYSTKLNLIEKDYCDRLLRDVTQSVKSSFGDNEHENLCLDLINSLKNQSLSFKQNRLASGLNICPLTEIEAYFVVLLHRYKDTINDLKKEKLSKKAKCNTYVDYVLHYKSSRVWSHYFSDALMDAMCYRLIANSPTFDQFVLVCTFSRELEVQCKLLVSNHHVTKENVEAIKVLFDEIECFDEQQKTEAYEVLQQIVLLKHSLNRAYFFANKSKHSQRKWFELLDAITSTLTWSHCCHLAANYVSDLTEFFSIIVDLDLEQVLNVVSTTLPSRWLIQTLLCAMWRFAPFIDDQQRINLEIILYSTGATCSSLLSLMVKKLRSERELVALQATTFNPVDIVKQFCDICVSSAELQYDRLLAQPLQHWPTIFREKMLLQDWPLEVAARISEVDVIIGVNAMDNFLSAAKQKSANTANDVTKILLEVLDTFIRNPWLKASHAAMLRKLCALEDWTEVHCRPILNEIVASCKHECLSVSELADLMRNNANNDTIEHLLQSDGSKPCKLVQYVSAIHNYIKKVVQWKKDDIVKWAKEYRKSASQNESIEKQLNVLAIVCQAVKLVTGKDNDMKSGYYPRDTQLIAIIVFLDASRMRKGRLGEIATGEGKTVTIAMFVVMQALLGDCINVISSSSVLAVESAVETNALYSLFGISVTNNCDQQCEANEEQRRERYKSDVIYGDLSSFQRDVLLTEFFGKNITRGRSPGCIIVDEVDSMLLDKSANVLYLSHDIPDFQYFNNVFIEIWKAVHAPDVGLGTESDIAMVVRFIKRRLNDGSLELPAYLMSTATDHMVLWVKNAYVAKNYIKVKDTYVLADVDGKGMQVVIVDKDTGVEQVQMQWSYGLHQFLQLKHGDSLRAESLKAVFISNLGYFNRFPNRIFGVSGTLGSEPEKRLLADVYHLETFKMPRFTMRRCYEKNSCIVVEQEQWLAEIVANVKRLTEVDKRAVLIICENVDAVELVASRLQQQKAHLDGSVQTGNLYSYKSAFDKVFHQRNKEHPLSVGDVIVATNLAGRGTDLKIHNQVESNGGLHVIITFMPSNVRTEMQAEGRTARAGHRGSYQFIIAAENQSMTLEAMKAVRNEQESQRIEEIRCVNIQRLIVEEHLFQQFTELYSAVKEILLSETYESTENGNYATLQLEFLLTHWALWLDKIDDQLDKLHCSNKTKFSEIFDTYFKESMMSKVRNNSVIKLAELPSQLLKLGQHFEQHKKLVPADLCFSKCVDELKDFAEVPRYYRACCQLRADNYSITSKKKAIQDLKLSAHLLRKRASGHMSSAQILNVVNERRQESGEAIFRGRFEKQVQNWCKLLQIHVGAIERAIGKGVDAHLFESVVGISGKEEARELFDCIRQMESICKNFRLAKNIRLSDSGDQLIICVLGANKPLVLPPSYTPCKQLIIEALKRKITCTNDKHRCVESNYFENIPLSKADVWQLMIEAGFIEQETKREYECIICTESSFEELLLPDDLACFKELLQKLLISLNGSQYDGVKIFADLRLEDSHLSVLENKLREKGFIVSNVSVSARISSKFKLDNDLSSEPLLLFKDIITSWINSEESNDGIVTLENIPFFDSRTVASQRLWVWLQDAGVIKECKINYSLQDAQSKSFDTWTNQTNDVLLRSQSVYQIYKKYNTASTATNTSNEFRDYVSFVVNVLKQSVGDIVSMPKVEVSFKAIELYFQNADEFPPEIADFQLASFSGVLTLGACESWWNWNAFAVAMIGLAQVAAGILLAIATAGLATPLALVLIGEGVGDMIFATQAGLTKSFSWSSYGTHKVISVAISLLTLGIGSYFARGAQVVTTAVAVTSTQVFKVCATHAVKSLMKGFGNMLLDMGIEWVLNSIRENLMKGFGGQIRDKVKEKFADKMDGLNVAMQKILNVHRSEASRKVKDSYEMAMKKFQKHTTLTSQVFSKALVLAQNFTQAGFGCLADVLMNKAQGMQAGGMNLASKAATIAKISKYTSRLLTAGKYISNAAQMAEFSCEYFNIVIQVLESKTSKVEVATSSIKLRMGNTNTAVDNEVKLAFDKTSEECLTASVTFIADYLVKQLQQAFLQPLVKAITQKALEKLGNKLIFVYRTKIAARWKLPGYWEKVSVQKSSDDNTVTDSAQNKISKDEPVANGSGLSVKFFVELYSEDEVQFYRDADGHIHVDRPNYMQFVKSLGTGKKAGLLELAMCANALGVPIKVKDKTSDRAFTSNSEDDSVTIYPDGIKTDTPPLELEYTSNEKGEGHFSPVIDGQPQQIEQDETTKNCCLYQAVASSYNSQHASDGSVQKDTFSVRQEVRDHAYASTESQYLYERNVQEWAEGLLGGAPRHIQMPTDEVNRKMKSGDIKSSQKTIGFKNSQDKTIPEVAESIETQGYDANRTEPIRAVENEDGTITAVDHRVLMSAASINSPDTEVPMAIYRLDEEITGLQSGEGPAVTGRNLSSVRRDLVNKDGSTSSGFEFSKVKITGEFEGPRKAIGFLDHNARNNEPSNLNAKPPASEP